MRIFVTGTRGFPNVMGGVETHCEKLYTRIVKMGMDVTVFRRSAYISDNLKNWQGVDMIDINVPKNKFLEALLHTFKSINKAKKMGAKLVHIHAIGPAILTPYAKLLGMKVVITHHGPDYERKKWNKFAKAFLKTGEAIGCLCADHVIVISQFIQQQIARKYKRTKNVHLIHNGIGVPDICDYDEYFNQLGIQKGKYVIYVCRFVPEKNIHQLIQAFSEIEHGDYKLVIAGDADFKDKYSQQIKQMADETGTVLTGFVKDKKLHSLLANAKLFAMPSSYEGLPISLLEAMSYRLPVIVSDIPANKEMNLNKDYYFECGNIEQLKSLLKKAIDEPFHRVDYDLSEYDWDVIAEKTFQIYKQIENN